MMNPTWLEHVQVQVMVEYQLLLSWMMVDQASHKLTKQFYFLAIHLLRCAITSIVVISIMPEAGVAAIDCDYEELGSLSGCQLEPLLSSSY